MKCKFCIIWVVFVEHIASSVTHRLLVQWHNTWFNDFCIIEFSFSSCWLHSKLWEMLPWHHQVLQLSGKDNPSQVLQGLVLPLHMILLLWGWMTSKLPQRLMQGMNLLSRLVWALPETQSLFFTLFIYLIQSLFILGSRNAGQSFASVASRAKPVEGPPATKRNEVGKKGKKPNRVLMSTAGGRRY